MPLLRPVALSPSGRQGEISQRFDGQFAWEPPGYFRRLAASQGRRSSFVGATRYQHIHLAIDYIVAIGTPCRAVKRGRIIGQGRDSTGAKFVYLRIRRGEKFDMTFMYYHLDEFRHPIGTRLAKGDTVALSGNTGWSTGPHLHTELIRTPRGTALNQIFLTGLRFDPQPFIDGSVTLRSVAP